MIIGDMACFWIVVAIVIGVVLSRGRPGPRHGRRCRQCNARNILEARYCARCGARLR